MTIEDKLKEYIMTKYSSLREFTQKVDLPYSTMTTILKRGLANSNVLNIIKICKELNISADELAAGKIVPMQHHTSGTIRIEDVIQNAKQEIINADHLTLNDQHLDPADIKSIINSLDLLLEIEKRNKRMI